MEQLKYNNQDSVILYLLPIHNTIQVKDIDFATKYSWKEKDGYAGENVFALGINRQEVVSSYNIERWTKSGGKSNFSGDWDNNLNFVGKRVENVLNANENTKNYWKYGNHLVIEVKNGKFKFIKGSPDKTTEYDL